MGRTRFTLVTQISDALGRSLQFAYDSQARLSSVTEANAGVTSFNHRIASKTDPRGAVITFQYDAAGRTTSEALPEGGTYQYAYTAAGNIVAETRVTDPNGNLTTWRFNGQGFPTRTVDALGRVTAQSVDFARNLVLSDTDPLGRVTRYTYDQNGNRTSVKDNQGNLTVTDYDPLFNKPTKITNALGFVTNNRSLSSERSLYLPKNALHSEMRRPLLH